MSFARKLKRKTQNKRKTRCCGQQMTHKAGYGMYAKYAER